jgi:aryl-alcohol dehydrogenase-like predicted oxidoreductase
MTGPLSPRLALGYAQLGNLYRARSEEEAAAILEEAWSAGIRQFDTAPHTTASACPSDGWAPFLRGKPRDQFSVSTKVGRLLSRARRGHCPPRVLRDELRERRLIKGDAPVPPSSGC